MNPLSIYINIFFKVLLRHHQDSTVLLLFYKVRAFILQLGQLNDTVHCVIFNQVLQPIYRVNVAGCNLMKNIFQLSTWKGKEMCLLATILRTVYLAK